MSALNGTWKLIYADNIGEYCDAVGRWDSALIASVNSKGQGTKSELKEQAMKLLTPDNDIIQEISCKDNGVSIVTKMPGTQSEVQATYGQAVEQKYLDGRPIKVTFSLEDDKLKEEQSGPFTSNNVRYVENDNLIYKMTAGDVTTTRKYKKV